MTNSQHIEVAEKVWGWNPADCPYYKKVAELLSDNDDNFKVEATDLLRAEVNSWAGFGRTVEAMAEKGLYFFNIPNEIRHTDYRKVIFNKLSDRDIKKLIEATHLAALEELKK